VEQVAIPSPIADVGSTPRHSVGVWSVLLFLAILWFVLCRHLSSEWSLNEQYSYGWFVPFFAAYLLWLRREDAPEPESKKEEVRRKKWGNGIAIGVAIVALVVLLPVRLFEVANPDWRPLGWIHAFAVVAITFAVIYFAGGWRWTKHFSFPILFFLVAVPWISPIEAPIVQGLMRIIAAAATETVTLLGIPAQVQGNLIRIATGVVGINEACSGVRSLQTSLMIGLLFGELKRFSVGRRVVLVAGAVGIALVFNFFRAVFLVWVASEHDLSAVDRWHDFAGYAIVAAVFLGTVLLAWALAKGRSKKEEGRSGEEQAEVRRQKAEGTSQQPEKATLTSGLPPPSSGSRFCLLPCAFILSSLAWLVAVEVGVEAWYRAHEGDLVARRAWRVRMPARTAGFREIKIEDTVRQTLRFDSGQELAWKTTDPDAPGNPTTNYLFSFRWNPGSSSVVRARAHRPDICLPDAGWKQLVDYGTKTYVSKDGIELPARHVSFKQDGGTAIVHTFFCLQEDKVHREEARPDLQLAQGRQPDWSLRARARVVRNGVRNLGQQVLEVLFLNPQPIDEVTAKERFARFVRDVISAERQ
jgi:exosortase